MLSRKRRRKITRMQRKRRGIKSIICSRVYWEDYDHRNEPREIYVEGPKERIEIRWGPILPRVTTS